MDVNGKKVKKRKDKEKEKKKKKNNELNKVKKKKKNSELTKLKRKTRSSLAKVNDEQNQEKCKNFHGHKIFSNSCFTAPLPPSHHIKNNSHVNQSSDKSAPDSDDSPRPEKVKSRWRRKSELESGGGVVNGEHNRSVHLAQEVVIPKETETPPEYEQVDENIYLFERCKSKSKKEVRRMVCDCILTKEERQRGLIGCGDDCLNRMLMIECGSRCSLGDHCANKRFQKKQNSKVEPFRTAKKGWGLRALEPIHSNSFIMEYVGEVLDPLEFSNRVKKYSKEKKQHYYFMALKSDEIIDATVKGNITRFVNHSCDPNSETQKWTVNGELRIGFFTKRFIQPGEEITFDYQFQRYGKEAQKCFCESSNCRGFIGANESADIYTDGTRMTPKQRIKNAEIDEKLKSEDFLEDLALEEEIAKLAEAGGLRSRQQVLKLARLMVRAEDSDSRQKLINIIKGTIEVAYLRLLLDYHCLQLIWSWMSDADDIFLKAEILEVLEILPIPNKTMLIDSKVLSVVERWAQIEDDQDLKQSIVNQSSQSSINTVESGPSEFLNSEIKEESATEKCEEKNEPLEGETNLEEPKIEGETESSNANIIDNQENVDLQNKEESKTNELENIVENIDNNNESKILEENESLAMKEEKSDSALEESENKVNEINTEMVDIKNEIKEEEEEKDKTLEQDNKTELKENQNQENDSKSSSSKSSLASRFISTLIRSKSSESSKLLTIEEPLNKPKPNISAFAKKLLNLWKDLKETFRIPRLERQKRHEDEQEADRRTKEVEERRAKGLPEVFETRKMDDRDYTIAGILGIKRKGLKRTIDGKEFPKKINSIATDNTIGTPPKISREEHRKQFEQEVAQKDYQEALKKYHEELAFYNAMYGNYLQNQNYNNNNAANLQDPNLMPDYYNQFYQSDQNFPSDYYNQGNSNLIETFAEVNESSEIVETANEIPEEITYHCHPTIINLTNVNQEFLDCESCLEVDNQDFKQYENFLPKDNQIFDSIFAPPGIYYLTPEGRTLFVPLPTDVNDHVVKLKAFENITLPHLFDKNEKYDELPINWKEHKDKNNRVYYYNTSTRQSQWMRPKEERTTKPLDSPKSLQCSVKSDEESKCKITPNVVTKIEEDTLQVNSQLNSTDTSELQEMIADSATTDSCNVTQNDEIASSEPNTPILISYEADPRKRKHLLNSSFTTTAAADTSSAHCRRRLTPSQRKIVEHFRNKMSQCVVHFLNPYRRDDCKQARISTNEDFKYLARKLTHCIVDKEIKHCKSIDELSYTEAVKHKTKDFVKRYMAKQGTHYKPEFIERNNSPVEQILQTEEECH